MGHTQPPIQWVTAFFLCRESGWGIRLTTNFYPVPRLRMRGATPTLPLYTLMACTERTSPLPTSPLPNVDWKNVVPYWQVLHSYGYRQAKWTYKEDSQSADTKSGIWADYGQQQWQVEQWHSECGRAMRSWRRWNWAAVTTWAFTLAELL
jgi:hypothetical protein